MHKYVVAPQHIHTRHGLKNSTLLCEHDGILAMYTVLGPMATHMYSETSLFRFLGSYRKYDFHGSGNIPLSQQSKMAYLCERKIAVLVKHNPYSH
jgi:hypothetical protein